MCKLHFTGTNSSSACLWQKVMRHADKLEHRAVYVRVQVDQLLPSGVAARLGALNFPAKESRTCPGYPFRTCLDVGGEYMLIVLSVNEQS